MVMCVVVPMCAALTVSVFLFFVLVSVRTPGTVHVLLFLVRMRMVDFAVSAVDVFFHLRFIVVVRATWAVDVFFFLGFVVMRTTRPMDMLFMSVFVIMLMVVIMLVLALVVVRAAGTMNMLFRWFFLA